MALGFSVEHGLIGLVFVFKKERGNINTLFHHSFYWYTICCQWNAMQAIRKKSCDACEMASTAALGIGDIKPNQLLSYQGELSLNLPCMWCKWSRQTKRNCLPMAAKKKKKKIKAKNKTITCELYHHSSNSQIAEEKKTWELPVVGQGWIWKWQNHTLASR